MQVTLNNIFLTDITAFTTKFFLIFSFFLLFLILSATVEGVSYKFRFGHMLHSEELTSAVVHMQELIS